MHVRLLEYKDFQQSLVQLAQKGGSFRKAADKIYSVLGRAGHEENPLVSLKTTNHGETRIRKCIKYDLSGASRLITVQFNNACILLYAGAHDDCDKWLEANRGRQFAINLDTKQIQTTRSDTSESTINP